MDVKQPEEPLEEDSNSEDETTTTNVQPGEGQPAIGDKKKKKKNKKKNKAKTQVAVDPNAPPSAATTTEPATTQQAPPAPPQEVKKEPAVVKEEAKEDPSKAAAKKKKGKGAKKEESDDDFLNQMIQENLKKQAEESKGNNSMNSLSAPSLQDQIYPRKKNQMDFWCPPGTLVSPPSRFQDNSELRILGNWAAQAPGSVYLQTSPPTIPIDKQFPDGKYPVGQLMNYSKSYNSFRTTKSELKEKDKLCEDQLVLLRKAAETHRQVRKHAQKIIKPGRRLIDICNEIEELNRFLVGENGLKAGIAFPTGCSINNVAAHYTPNSGDDTVVGKDDVIKIDYGTQVEGRIIDCAFTVAFNPKFDPLLIAVKEATDAGIRSAGVDARLGEVGGDIQQVMESHEIDLDGKTYQIRSVQNLNGHSIDPYRIHAGKSVPIIKTNNNTKMEENEQYAIETFGSTGKAVVQEDMECSHYMKEFGFPRVNLKSQKSKELLKYIDTHYSTLAFCRQWLDRGGMTNHILPLKELCNVGIINPYPPLCDVKWSYVAQYEHTIFLQPSGKEVLSRGDDY